MKKISLLAGALLACFMQVNAQDFVSTEPQNKNVLIEEFTGRNCGYCPDGHVIANQICHNNPDRVWAMNIHAGGFSPTSLPNLNTTDGTAICNGFAVTGFPAGVVNRSTPNSIDRGQWAAKTNQELAMQAVCNVAGQAVINPATRLATITVEIYYTGDNAESTNYLTVAMLQDSIWGSQAGGSMNPEQYVGGQYCHMHILRDIITDTWGEAISPTTAGTLITKTFKYTIPESIGDPNGVDVDLNNLHFLAFVSEKHESGGKTMPILNVCELSDKENEDEDSLDDVNAASFNVYPNPVKDEIRISSEEMIENIAIYNINGQQLIADCQNPTANSCAVNVSNLNPGVYFIKVNGKAQKFVKQ